MTEDEDEISDEDLEKLRDWLNEISGGYTKEEYESIMKAVRAQPLPEVPDKKGRRKKRR